MDITLIFPDQLFEKHPAVAKGRTVVLPEEFLFFRVQSFHKQRLALLRSAMRAYHDSLVQKKIDVIYVPASDLKKRGDLFALLAKKKVKSIHLAEFSDEFLKRDLHKAASKNNWEMHFYPSPGFMCTESEVATFFRNKKHYSMAQFYMYQRKKTSILMQGGEPVGGKYSFDPENRKKLPKNIPLPRSFFERPTDSQIDLMEEIERDFPDAIGASSALYYPYTHEGAKKVLGQFVREKLQLFGDYQDAIKTDDSALFHSLLSPVINIGLLTPDVVVQTVLDYASKHSVPLNALEGFIRQVIGWREFVRGSYAIKGVEMRSKNFFGHHHKIPESFWKGTTGILPIDSTVQRALKTGYSHHIERLMVLGSFLLLTETAPEEVYGWFMANFVDAYDWVMVPNVYGMSQYADGGLIVTKPYICGSNYLLKMSDYPKGEWTEIWDGLFWRFLRIHRKFFEQNPRMGALVQLLAKNEKTIVPKIDKAEKWLQEYRRD